MKPHIELAVIVHRALLTNNESCEIITPELLFF